MSVWGKRESYKMVAFTIGFWVVLSAVAWVAAPLIPPEEEQLLIESTDSFLARSASQQISWRTWDESVVRDSRRKDLPILLVLGTGYSQLGQSLDNLFKISEVSEAVNESCIPVRIDLERYPGWRSRFLPLTKGLRGDVGLLQLFLIDYEGNLVAAPTDSEVWVWNDANLISWINSGRRLYLDRNRRPLQREQERQEYLLTGGTDSGIPEVDGYIGRILTNTKSSLGQVPLESRTYLQPGDLILLSESGFKDEARIELNRLISSQAADVLGGGFFFFSRTSDWQRVVYTKVRCLNSDMLLAMHHANFKSGSLGRYHLIKTFDNLATEVAGERMATYTTSKQDDAGRSWAYSFSPNRMRPDFPRKPQNLNAIEREWAAQVLGLDVTKNLQMSVFVRNPMRFMTEPEMRDRVIGKLKFLQKAGVVEEYGQPLLTKRGYVLANLLQVSKGLDEVRQERVLSMAMEYRNQVRVGMDDVYGWKNIDRFEPGGLESYLVYSRLALVAFDITGDVSWREDAILVMKRALFLFTTGGTRILADSSPQSTSILNVTIPDHVDADTSSLVSQAVSISARIAKSAKTAGENEFWTNQGRSMIRSFGEVFNIADQGSSRLAASVLELQNAAELTY